MPVVVWGTKVKTEQAGALAVDCPACLERTIADEFVVSSARHIYFIHGGYNEATRYARCRLCGMASPMPHNSTPITDINLHEVVPNEDIIARSNPSIADKPPADAFVKVDYPPGVTRLQAALFGAILECAKAQGKQDKVMGFTGGLAILLLPAAIFLSSYFDNPVVPLAVVFIAGAIGILLLHSWMLHNAVAKEMRPFVRRVIKHAARSIDDLIVNADKLGKRYRKVSNHLQKMRMEYM